ncbi:MAG: hypothetical protein WCS15_06940 [Prevotella sp.]
MMTRDETRKINITVQKMVRRDFTLNDGFSYYYYQDKTGHVEYPISQAQKLFEYSKEHQFMFISDWILAWLYAGEDFPVTGITMLQKSLFIVFMEFAQKHDIPSENPGFTGYKFGPYTEAIDYNLNALIEMGLVISNGRINSQKERFFLTEHGKEAGLKAFNKLKPNQKKDVLALRCELQKFDTQGIMTYVYKKYPEYTDDSLVFERTLHRKRS